MSRPTPSNPTAPAPKAPGRPYANVLVVGVQRTGSSALAELLNTHPEIAIGWEWTERLPPWRKLSVLESSLQGDFQGIERRAREHIEASVGAETRWLGFRRLFGASNKWLGHPRFSAKLFYDCFERHRRWLAAHPQVRVVHIIREDDLGWLKSKFLARAMGQFVGQAYPEDARISIPLSDALARVKAKHWVDQRLGLLRQTNPYLRVAHEDFAERLPAIGQEVARFLDCSPDGIQPDNTVIRRQSTRPAADYIENYAALAGALDSLP